MLTLNLRHARTGAVACVFTAAASLACAQSALPQSGQVFTCVNAAGRTLTSDRLIPDCMDREQRVLGRDGSLIRVVPPQLTAEERAEKEARERRATAEREARAEAARLDRNLMQRFPDEAAHNKVREAELEDVRAAIRRSQQREKDLERERKPLLSEAEFFQGKPLPAKLKQQIDANDAGLSAQKDIQANQRAELERVAKRFDVELARLKKLWAGAAPGSLGPISSSAASEPSAKGSKPLAVAAKPAPAASAAAAAAVKR